MRKYLVIGLVALCIVAMAAPVFALEVKFSGNFRVRAAVQAELDGKNQWTDVSIRNAIASGNYAPTHIYDRGSHFLRAGPGGEDNASAGTSLVPTYVSFVTAGPSAGATADTVIGPRLPATGSGPNIQGLGTKLATSGDAGASTGQAAVDDEEVHLDQRFRLWMTFQIADCVRQVTAFEVGDSTWGYGGFGADWGADDVRVEVKQCYIDFSIPALPFPTNFKVGVIPVKLHRGWILDVDAAGILATATFEPVTVGLVYIRANESAGVAIFNPEDRSDDADAAGVFVVFSMDQLSAQATFLYQDGPSATFSSGDSATWGATEEFGNTIMWYALDADYTTESFKVYFTGAANGGSNDYYRLNDRGPAGGVALSTMTPVEADYNGYMVNLGLDVYLGPFTLMLEGFYVTGDEFKDHTLAASMIGIDNFFAMEDSDDAIDRFVYPGPNPWNANGATHYWSEILGAGTFDMNSLGAPVGNTLWQSTIGNGSFGQWQGGLQPYNVWAVKLGGKYKLTDDTTISAFYWYCATVEDVVSSIKEDGAAAFGSVNAYGNVIATDSALGHEVNLYIDQKLCDGLVLRLVGAYLFSDDAYSIWEDDENAYEYGARLQVSF